MSTKISENTTYRTGCHDCGATSQDFRNRWDAEAWENTHNTSHHEAPPAVTDEVTELQKVNKRLVDHNTQLTRENTTLQHDRTVMYRQHKNLVTQIDAAEVALDDRDRLLEKTKAELDHLQTAYIDIQRHIEETLPESDDSDDALTAALIERNFIQRLLEEAKAKRDEAWELVDKADDERDTAHQSADQMGHLNKRLRDERNAAVDDAKSLRAELTAAVAHVAAEQHRDQEVRVNLTNHANAIAAAIQPLKRPFRVRRDH